MKVLVMGLGLHGGGLESARYLYRRGAELTVTDLRDEKTLAPSIEQLEAEHGGSPGRQPVRYVLGRHEIDDFRKADMVIKNPGVRPDSPFLKAARRIETDISLFLSAAPARISAVTGSKGKSCTTSALHWVLARAYEKSEAGAAVPRRAYLGGNITVSPLAFLDDLRETDDVVLELSSWQLGDLRGRFKTGSGVPLLKPRASVLTTILPDHQDFYGGMVPYVADKRVIYEGQGPDDVTVAWDDEWGSSFLAESRASGLTCSILPLPEGTSGGWLPDPDGPAFARLYGALGNGVFDGSVAELVPARPLVPGYHQKRNFLAAGLALLGLGLPADAVREHLETFPGIEHRMELFHRARGIDFYNDSAATIPEAAAAALETLGGEGRMVLVTGGTDKDLDFSPLARVSGKAKAIVLLAGTGSEKLQPLLEQVGTAYLGPFDSPDAATAAALGVAAEGDSVVLSPGCASFGMFLNEFDRGRRWKDSVRRLA